MNVYRLYVIPARGVVPAPRMTVRCTHRGLEGDHKADGTVVLVERHVVPVHLRGVHRRQVVVDMHPFDEDTLWEHFEGLTMYVGSAVLEPLEPCEPCWRLVKVTEGISAIPQELVHTGLRCRVVEPGDIAVGSSVGWTIASTSN